MKQRSRSWLVSWWFRWPQWVSATADRHVDRIREVYGYCSAPYNRDIKRQLSVISYQPEKDWYQLPASGYQPEERRPQDPKTSRPHVLRLQQLRRHQPDQGSGLGLHLGPAVHLEIDTSQSCGGEASDRAAE